MNIIRLIDPNDPRVESARSVSNRSWVTTYSPLLGDETTSDIIETRHSQLVFQEQAEKSKSLFLVAERAGAVIGHCHAYPEDGWYVDRLHVEPELKGGGAGRAMMEAVFAHVPQGARIWLTVLSGNDAAMGFYERVGFAKIGETRRCGGLAGIPAAIYEKTNT